ncbi:MAG: hypothetical protein ACRDYA_17145 [Egibacteraceae bacterium]
MTLAATAVVVIAAAPATAQDPCGVPAAPSWTPTETTVWQQLCAGQWADLNPAGQTLDPDQPDSWDDRRVVSSAFVEQLLTQPYAAAIDRHGIRLRGAWFPNGLDLGEAAMSFPLRCQACRIARLQADETVIDGTLDLSGSAVEGDLSLLGADIRADLIVSGGSVVSGTLTADRLTVAGSVFLRDESKFTDIRLLSADIGSNLSASGGSVVSGTLTADGLTVTGSVFLSDESKFTDIRLPSADIGSNLEVDNGSVVSGTLNADGLTVAGAVFLRDESKFTNIRLLGAGIGGDLAVSGGSVVSGTLNADRLTVTGDVFLRDESKFTDIRLLGADIGGQLAVDSGSVVSGTLAADGLTVAGDVFLDEGSEFNNIDLPGADIGGLVYLGGARWEPGGSLDLGQARAGGVWTDDRADSWPATIRLNGFEFEQWANPDPRTLGSDWFTGVWLARLDTFSPGPYNQLAAVMDAAGHPTIAADVRYHRSHAQRLEVGWRRPEGWGRALHWLVLGYGFRPWWAAGWFLAVWAIGYLVFRVRLQPDPARTPDEAGDGPRPGRMRRWRARVATVGRVRLGKAEQWPAGQAALYSLDRLLPAFKLVDPGEFPKRTRAQQAWSTVQMLLGWMLTLFIVGWLGSLLVQP